MPANPTRAYPLTRAENGLPLAGVPGVPHVPTEFATKAEAEELVATGAWTLNPNDPNRVPAEEPTPEPAPPAEEE